MGGNASRAGGHTRKEHREQIQRRNDNINNAIETRKNEINTFCNNLNVGTDIILRSQIKSIDGLISIANIQLNRRYLPLTKNDLITIIVALDRISDLNSMTVKELLSAIRLIIYDPKRYVKTNEETNEVLEATVHNDDEPTVVYPVTNEPYIPPPQPRINQKSDGHNNQPLYFPSTPNQSHVLSHMHYTGNEEYNYTNDTSGNGIGGNGFDGGGFGE